MSAYFSCTAITSVDTMLNAATATIRNRITVIIVFSSATARKKFAWLRVQSVTITFSSMKPGSSRATRGAAKRSSSFSRTPLTRSPMR